jgi:cysteine desulfurase
MIYLDNNASTKLDAEAAAAMAEAADLFGNPSSIHAEGRMARRRIEEARDEVARLVGASSEEIFFTSGGTEANALALFGAAGHPPAQAPGRLVRTAAEHPSVAEAMDRLATRGGFESVVVAPRPSGVLDPDELLAAIAAGTRLVSVMAANNEYGALYPVAELAPQARARGAIFHTDAVQAAGRISVDVRAWQVDLASFSAHKMHGPKGVGALYVRRGLPLQAHTPGGGQEKKLRAGTENTAGIVGFGCAARLARERLSAEAASIAARRDRLEQGLCDRIPGARVIGADASRLPNTSAVLFEGVRGETLIIRLDLEGIAVSTGSACSSGTLLASPAIRSLGLSREQAGSVVRFSLSRLTTDAELTRVLEVLPGIVAHARHVASEGAIETAEELAPR